MASGDSKKMLNHCIYNYMKEKGLHVAADVFAVEANLDLGEYMLKDWWRLFWPQFSSRLANKARGNSRPSVQPSMDDVIAMLASSEKQGAIGSQQALGGNPPQNVIPIPVTNQLMIANSGPAMDNFMENPPVSSRAVIRSGRAEHNSSRVLSSRAEPARLRKRA
ncbi:uncharacterized protein LOC108204645 isoform X2 [Daucus carota subsp. sativus]|uniref:uncharacterized protein LOC108204645 isoform X2 n=1 Tax=Daucus carota subsp. sativus TaxID=79200 RepID=UPI0030838DA6